MVVTCENGKKYQAQYVISAMPQPLLNSVSFDPPLPPLKNQLIQRMPLGSSIKTITFYKKAFWREKGLNGMVISDSGPAHISVDDTKPDGSCPAIMRYKMRTDISCNYFVIINFHSYIVIVKYETILATGILSLLTSKPKLDQQ